MCVCALCLDFYWCPYVLSTEKTSLPGAGTTLRSGGAARHKTQKEMRRSKRRKTSSSRTVEMANKFDIRDEDYREGVHQLDTKGSDL